ncbi:hypothetical protein DEO72_LG6g2326 [Vigna unguiculata]|uniref:Armadillo-type fold n=1 Tax=Vigna unguiculata TaxID=3917 RepID=A0A4D6M8J9_VIGUN|nr:hypothetical protein DEO72_LG6g2326 [Vigna unguiculata]
MLLSPSRFSHLPIPRLPQPRFPHPVLLSLLADDSSSVREASMSSLKNIAALGSGHGWSFPSDGVRRSAFGLLTQKTSILLSWRSSLRLLPLS